MYQSELFNFWILRMREHGLTRKYLAQFGNQNGNQDNKDINKVAPLNYNNVVFPFAILLWACITTPAIALVEKIVKRKHYVTTVKWDHCIL